MDASSKFRDSLPTSPEHLLKTMKAMKLTYYLREHPPLKTVNDAKKYQKKNSGFHVKNLFLRDQKKRNYLLVTEQDDKIDLKIMSEKIGSGRLSFGSPERLFEFLGVRSGAVSPLALINDKGHKVKIWINKELSKGDLINFHPLVNDLTVQIGYDDFRLFLNYTGHQLNIFKLD